MAINAARMLCDVFYLALVIWREARGASHDAQVAIGWTVMNRVARPGWWGTTIDEISTKRFQFSSLTAPGDPQLVKWPVCSDASWLACLGVAYDILHGDEPTMFPGADSYYDDSIAAPAWTHGATLCGKIDNLNFYDVDHDHEAVALVAAGGTSDFDNALKAFLEG
jgi:hypothetical protein